MQQQNELPSIQHIQDMWAKAREQYEKERAQLMQFYILKFDLEVSRLVMLLVQHPHEFPSVERYFFTFSTFLLDGVTCHEIHQISRTFCEKHMGLGISLNSYTPKDDNDVQKQWQKWSLEINGWIKAKD